MRGSAALCACWKAWPAARIRRSRRSGVIFYIVMITTTAWSTTSAPPTAEPLLKERPFGGRSIQRSQIATNDKCTQPSPPWHADEIGAGWRSQTKGESRKRTEESLLSSGRFRLSPATGTYLQAPPSSLTQQAFTATMQPSLVLSWAPRKYRFSLPHSLLSDSTTSPPAAGRVIVCASSH